MWELIESRLEGLARRAGVTGVSPPVLVAAGILCACACVWAVWRFWPPAPAVEGAAVTETAIASKAAPVTHMATSAGGASAPEAGPVVHVAGSVRHPGVYELAAGSRVADAVDAAGGLLPDAVSAAVNLARPVADGEQIVVPSEDEVRAGAAGGAPGATSTGQSAGAAPGPVDLNSADAAALDTLPGIGPATAAKIVADREANGPFASVDDLSRVSGIGEKKCEQLAGLACVR